MIEIIPAHSSHIKDIQAIVNIAWYDTFQEILSSEQIKYMMNRMYGTQLLHGQMQAKHHRFFLAKENNSYRGYLSTEHNCERGGKNKIHKIYLLPKYHQKDTGKKRLETAINEAKIPNNPAVFLNVNKNNQKAIGLYRKNGFAGIGHRKRGWKGR